MLLRLNSYGKSKKREIESWTLEFRLFFFATEQKFFKLPADASRFAQPPLGSDSERAAHLSGERP